MSRARRAAETAKYEKAMELRNRQLRKKGVLYCEVCGTVQNDTVPGFNEPAKVTRGKIDRRFRCQFCHDGHVSGTREDCVVTAVVRYIVETFEEMPDIPLLDDMERRLKMDPGVVVKELKDWLGGQPSADQVRRMLKLTGARK